MVKAVQFRRLLGLALVLGLALAALGGRLFYLQAVQHEELTQRAAKNTQYAVLREPQRGEIRDIRGNILATSRPAKTVCADPSLIGQYHVELARALAPRLALSEAELTQRLTPRTRVNENGKTVPVRYVTLQRKVTTETWQQIQQTLAEISFGRNEKSLPRAERAFLRNLRQYAIFADPVDDQLRVYPNQTLAAHVLGYVGMEEREKDRRRVIETAGKEGIELAFDSKLAGVRGWRQSETDRQKRELVAYREQDVAPRDGLNVVLTLDAGLQHIVESELAEVMKKHTPVSASSVVVRPRTGEILAMATLPAFDPGNPGAVPADFRRNRVIADIAEPGSTFKIVVVAAALNEQIVTLTDRFDCELGRFIFAGRALRDDHALGVLSVEEIIGKSSNIGAAKIGIKLGEERLYPYIGGFGFGARTGIPLYGEVNGIVHPVAAWSKLSISRIPMGHEVAVTPLQMVMAMSAIANQGWLMRPMLVERLEDQNGQAVTRYRPQPVRQVIRSEAARQMVTALKTVVTKDGTAAKAALEHYRVAGKTGTAQKAGPGGYQPGKHYSSFIGFFPADKPELCISVVLDEPKQGGYYGGQTAAPVFKNIAERAANYLNIRPDLNTEPATVDTLVVSGIADPVTPVPVRSP